MMQRYSQEWWARKYYVDAISSVVKCRRLWWVVAGNFLAAWMTDFVDRRWRVFCCRSLG